MPCFALNIDERKHINLKLVLVEMNIIRKYGVWKIRKMVVIKHLPRVQCETLIVSSIARQV